jgi:nucleotide-binding universal stress UspA family protein
VSHRGLLKLFLAAFIFGLLASAPVRAQGEVVKSVKTFKLGETDVKVNVYERAGAAVTFFAPHHNERGAREAAKEAVAARGGRFVEVESLDEAGVPARRLRFKVGGKPYGIDPNRIFTVQGRRCLNLPADAEAAVKAFAEELAGLLFAPGGRSLRAGERFFVAVHNNGDVEGRDAAERDADLTALGFVRPLRSRDFFRGEFAESAAGVYLSNAEDDEDNFALVTDPSLVNAFAGRGFNVVLQKTAAQLRDGKCSMDDGSLSVYAAFNDIPYVNLEADAEGGAARQRQMLQAVYDLLSQPAAPRD